MFDGAGEHVGGSGGLVVVFRTYSRRQKALSKQENDIIRFVFLRNPSELLLCVE